MLTLRDFVKETLSQIVHATHDFQKEHAATGATVSLELQQGDKAYADKGLIIVDWGVSESQGVKYATLVDFDVAITAEDTESAKAGGGIRVLSVLKAEGGLETQAATGSQSRVKFTLPLQIP